METTTIQNIRLYLIKPSKMNPRKTIDQQAVRELAESIKRQGLLQPVTVRPSKIDDGLEDGVHDGYEIVCGERRYRACSLLGLETIPAIVRQMSDEEALDAMITENLQRKDVDPLDEADAFRLLQQRGAGVKELGQRFGKSDSYIRDRISLCSLVPETAALLKGGKIPLGGAVLLSRLSMDEQLQFYDDIFDSDPESGERATVGDIEDWMRDLFMYLDVAVFIDDKELNEAWNEAGQPQRCKVCPCNTKTQGCLFPEMSDERAQCTNAACYEQKREMYYQDWVRRLDAGGRIVRQGEGPQPGRVVLLGSPYAYWNEDEKERYSHWKEHLLAAGYRVFSLNDLGGQMYGMSAEDRARLLADGKAVEVFDISDAVYGYKPSLRLFRLKEGESQTERDEPTAKRLADKLKDLRSTLDRQMDEELRKRLKESDYTSRKGSLELWEQNVLEAILMATIPQASRPEGMPQDHYISYDQAVTFLETVRSEHDQSWLRRVIASFMGNYSRENYLREGMKWIDSEGTWQLISESNDEYTRRYQEISDELKAMGRDEEGNVF